MWWRRPPAPTSSAAAAAGRVTRSSVASTPCTLEGVQLGPIDAALYAKSRTGASALASASTRPAAGPETSAASASAVARSLSAALESK
jgi:hypothetical protein